MKTVFLDGEKLRERADLFRAFETALDLPLETGRNLDALNDVLTERTDEIGVILVHPEAMEAAFPAFSEAFFRLMRDLQKHRPGFFFTDSPFGKREK